MITFKKVTKSYADGVQAVKSLQLEIHKGEFFVLIGPSGCGKTTTLKMVNRLIDPSEGSIWINDQDIAHVNIHELRWNIGYVLQQIALFPHLSIAENIAIVPELKKWEKERINSRVDELLAMVGLEPKIYRDRKPTELSGGEQQRIGVARALAADPPIILMDEPFSALDPISREKLQNDILQLQKSIHKTIVFVTHDMQEALKLGDRICLMKQGEVIQVGTKDELVENPVNDFVREFVGTKSDLHKVDLDITRIMRQVNQVEEKMETIPVETTLGNVLKKLAERDELSVEKDGKVIGIMDRQTVLNYMAEHLQEGGEKNE